MTGHQKKGFALFCTERKVCWRENKNFYWDAADSMICNLIKHGCCCTTTVLEKFSNTKEQTRL